MTAKFLIWTLPCCDQKRKVLCYQVCYHTKALHSARAEETRVSIAILSAHIRESSGSLEGKMFPKRRSQVSTRTRASRKPKELGPIGARYECAPYGSKRHCSVNGLGPCPGNGRMHSGISWQYVVAILAQLDTRLKNKTFLLGNAPRRIQATSSCRHH